MTHGDPPWLLDGAAVRRGMVDYRLALAPDIAEIPRLLDWVEACCEETGVGGATAAKLALALEEAAANVIQHAFPQIPPPHRLEVTLAIDAARIDAEIIDNGRPFDPLAAPEPEKNAPLGERDPGGLGIHLIRKMMDHVAYHRVDGENRLRLEKARD